MPKKKDSAGLVIYRLPRDSGGEVEFLLVHPGGPYWAKKDAGAWSIPKGEIDPGEDKFAAARRETKEETGFTPRGKFRRLPPTRQPSGKVVHAWAIEADFDPATLRSDTFEIEWPSRSGHSARFPEVDRAQWFGAREAFAKILPGQRPILVQALAKLGVNAAEPTP